MSKMKGLILTLLAAAMLCIPTLASASIEQVAPKLLPVEDGSRSDFALKMNNELFTWVEDILEGILNYERCDVAIDCDPDENLEVPPDSYLEIEELLNEYVFGPYAVPGSTIEPLLDNPLLSTCLTDIPILGNICLGLYLRDNDTPGDNAVVSFNSNEVPPAPFIIEIQGNSGSVYEIYTDDNLQITIGIEEIEIDLQLDEPTDPSTIEFSYPDGTTGTCDEYIAQQWDSMISDNSPLQRCVPPGGDLVDGYDGFCQATGTIPAGSVWAAAGDMLCDYPSPISATVANGCVQWIDDTDPTYDTIGSCNGTVLPGECTFYAAQCDLSNWVSIAADLTIGWDSDQFGDGAQDLLIGIGIRPLFAGNGTPTKANTAIGFELQHVDFGTNLVFELNVTITADHPQYEWSKDLDALLPAIDMVVRVYLEDLFKCDELPVGPGEPPSSFVNDPNCIGYYIGATELFDIADLLSGFLPLAHPLIPFIQVAGFPPFPDGSGNLLQFTEGVNGIGPFPTVASEGTGLLGAGINLDFGIVSDWMAHENWGAMMPANLFLDVQMVFMDATTDPPIPFTDPANNYGFIPYPSCTYQYDGRIGDLQDDAYPGRYTPNPATVVVQNQRPMFCDPPEFPSGTPNASKCGGAIGSGTGDEMLNAGGDYYRDSDGGGPIIFDTSEADRYFVGAGSEQMHFLQGDCNPTLLDGQVPGVGDPDQRGQCDGDYMLGIGLHQDVISELVYGLISSGILCLTIDPTEETGNSILDMFNGSDADSTLGSLLTLSTGNAILSFLLPELPEDFGTDAPIIIKLVPYTIDPRTRSKEFRHIPRAWTGGQITEVIDNQYSPATNPDDIMYEPTQYVYGADQFAFELPEIDLQIDVPHLLIEFWTKECNMSPADCLATDLVDRTYEAPQRVFSLDLGFKLGLDIDILSPMPSPMTFPSGAANSWLVTDTARTIFLGMVVDPNVKMLFSYIEDTNHTYPCVNSDHPVCGDGAIGYNDAEYGLGSVYEANDYSLAMLEDYMGNLLTTVLSLIAQFELRLTIDLGDRGIGTALPPIPLAVNGSIEASCSDAEADPVNGVCPRSTDQDTDNGEDGDTYGDFLQIYLQLTGDLPIAFIYQFLLCALIPTDPTCDGFEFSLDSLGLSPAGAVNRTEVLFETPNFNPPETTIMPIVNANPYEMVVDFQAYDNDSANESLLYSWRLDGSAWRPFLPLTYAVLRGLGDGVHTFEVRAIDEHKFLEPEPAKVQFVIDAMGPDIYLEGDQLNRIETRDPIFFARAYDHVYRKDVEISYSIDDQEWVPTEGEIMLSGLSDGSHVLNVKAADPHGNVSVASHGFLVSAANRYGCSATPKNGADLGLLMLLLIPSLMLVRRKVSLRK